MSGALGAQVVLKDRLIEVPPGLGQTPDSIAATYLLALESIHSSQSPRHEVTVLPRGIAGNGVCEAGESSLEPSCAVSIQACPALEPEVSGVFVGDPSMECGGNGVCSQAARKCVVFVRIRRHHVWIVRTRVRGLSNQWETCVHTNERERHPGRVRE